MSALLSVRDLRVEILTRAGPRRVVDDLSFDVAPGEVLALIGESGSGKSVAMQAIVGLLPSPPAIATGGAAHFEGRDLLAMPETDLRRVRGDRIGVIFQEPMSALDPMMAVGDQIAETIVVHRGLSWHAARAEAVRLLDRVRIPDAPARAKLHPAALSGGMRQRVVIAAAIACKPALVIADEPTTALDATVQAEILALLRELRAEVGCAVIFITHDMGVVRQVADRVLVMQRGAEVESGTLDEVLSRPRAAYTRTLIAAAAPVEPRLQQLPAAASPPLQIDNLVVSFPHSASMTSFRRQQRLFAVDGVSLKVGVGETVALVGESGSGKTTLARAVLGLVQPDRGRIRLRGEDVGASGEPQGRRVQFVFQDPQSSLDPRYRAWQSVTEPLRIAGERTGLRDRALDLLLKVGLDESHLDRLTHELSGGQRQRLGIARALSASPDLVIADEAVSALDATTKLQVLELFQRLQAEMGLPLLFITHDFAVVSRIAHRVAVMRFGRLVEMGPTASVLAAPHHPYTAALIAAGGGALGHGPSSGRGHRIGLAGSQRSQRAMNEVAPGHFVAQEDDDG